MFNLTEQFKKLIIEIFSYNPIVIRYAIAFGSILWGVLLMAPSEAYSIHLFTGMKQLFSEDIWGLLFLFHGIISVFHTITGKNNLLAFILDIVFGMLLWITATVALLMYTQLVPAPHLSAQISLTLCTMWLFIRFNLQKE